MNKKEKHDIIGKLYENNTCAFSQNVILLIQVMIDEYRVANDDAEGSEIIRNQGKIIALKNVYDYILKGIIPIKDEPTGINLT